MTDTEEQSEPVFLMCGKCGDMVAVSKEYKKRYNDTRWRCRSCLYAWI